MYVRILDRAVDDLRAVLKFCGVEFSIQLIRASLLRISLQLRCGTVHQLFLDIASLLVQRSMLNVLATVLGPALYQALSSRLNHRSISNSADFEAPPNVVAPSVSSSELEFSEVVAVEELRSSRVIPLPYIGQHERLTPRRRRKTVASLLGDSEYFVCKYCFKSFNRRYSMTRHIDRTHCGRVVFHCPQCPAVYRHSFHFADHLRTHEYEPQFFCDTCGQRSSSRKQLRSHLRRNCEVSVTVRRPASSRRSRQYEPQNRPFAGDPTSVGKFHIPYDFPVIL